MDSNYPKELQSYGLSHRLMNALINGGITDLKDLAACSSEEVENFKGMGPRSFDELLDVLSNAGVDFRDTKHGCIISNIHRRLGSLEKIQDAHICSLNRLERKLRELNPQMLHLDSLARCAECGVGMMPLNRNEIALIINGARVCEDCWDSARLAMRTKTIERV